MSSTTESASISAEPGAQRSRLLSDALLLSLLSVFFYALAFVYEAAYFEAFGIPRQLVHTSLDAVFVLAATVGGAVFLLYGIVNMIAMLWPKHPVVQIKIIRISLLLLLVLWPGLVYGFRPVDSMPILIAVLGVVVLEFAWPIFVFRDRASLAERFLADESTEDPVRARTLFGRLQVTSGPLAYGIVLGGYLALILARSAGNAEATRTKDFFFFEEEPGWLVVRAYPDRLVAAAFDATTDAVEPRIMVRAISPTGVRLVRKTVGPLKLHDTTLPKKSPNLPIQPSGPAGS